MATLSMWPDRPSELPHSSPCGVQLVQFTEKTFDQNNFGKLTVIGAERKCGESLQARMELLEKAVVISDAQRSKLELAGQT